jgi:hypothetical protein
VIRIAKEKIKSVRPKLSGLSGEVKKTSLSVPFKIHTVDGTLLLAPPPLPRILLSKQHIIPRLET